MKFSSIPYADTALLLSLLVAPLPTAAMFRCDSVVLDSEKFNLKSLGGPHSVVTTLVDANRLHNTTYTVDICTALKKKSGSKKGDQCHNGARVCAIERLVRSDGVDAIDGVTDIAGELKDYGGGDLDPQVSRLRKDDTDSGKDGLRVVLKGGFGFTEHGEKRKKQTVIDFVCNEDLDGTEGEYDSEDKYEPRLTSRADDEKTDDPDEDKDKDKEKDGEEDEGSDNDDDHAPHEVQLGMEKNPSLVFERYGPSDSDVNVDVLHLTWSSKYSCSSKRDDGDSEDPPRKSDAHWGAFTWIVILLFLGTAAYLIFGSWLNYTRYGARGWDLLPHGDTIRDIPYLLKEWIRRVLNTVQGSGSRGGYSAV
ncbi:autophagy-related protein 27 [Nemania sp. FL0916]|nr:autophagy-related protein 27 [Nemania sp. FL0916]